MRIIPIKINMMKFKPGDKVRFLNATGAGIVVSEINSLMVSVAIEDGFEIPTLISDLVLIEEKGASGNLFMDKKHTNPYPQPTKNKNEETPLKKEAEKKEYAWEPESQVKIKADAENKNISGKGIYLAWAPVDQSQVLTSLLNIYLVNYTSYDILFNLFLRNDSGSYEGQDFGSIAPHTKIIIDTIHREDILRWTEGNMQLMFHENTMQSVIPPADVHFKVKGSLFYSENAFKETDILTGNKSIVYTIWQKDQLTKIAAKDYDEKHDNEPLTLTAKRFAPEEGIKKHQTKPYEAEVDLHISALREVYQYLKPHEIFTIQIRYFERMLESAIAFKFQRVVFIHGIGNGILREAIIQKVKEYESIELRNASFAQYGNGALELILNEK